jgi:6-phosphogluconolactonase
MIFESANQTPVRNQRPRAGCGARVEVRSSAHDVADAAAQWLAATIRRLAAEKPTVHVAFSGGTTPQLMLQRFVRHQVPWSQLHVYQVDERCVADDDPRRNTHQLRNSVAPVFSTLGLGNHLHLMPIQLDLQAALEAAKAQVDHLPDGRFDIVHLGIGDDGHTASLVPDDPVLTVTDADVALTGLYQQTQRLTLTFPALLRADQLCWIATGATKAQRVAQLLSGDVTIPAGRLHHRPGAVFVDTQAFPASSSRT